MEKTSTSHTLPVSKKEVQLFDWITAKESDEVQSRYLRKMKGSIKGKELEMSGIEGTLGLEQDKALVQAYVMELDGKKPSVDEIMSLPNKDYRYLITQINLLESDEDEESEASLGE